MRPLDSVTELWLHEDMTTTTAPRISILKASRFIYDAMIAAGGNSNREPNMEAFAAAANCRKHGLNDNGGLLASENEQALYACFVADDASLWHGHAYCVECSLRSQTPATHGNLCAKHHYANAAFADRMNRVR